MPKIKLRGQQFTMIANSLRQTKKNEEFELYMTFCDSLGKEVTITTPSQLTYFEFVDTKTQAIENVSKTEKLLTAKVKLFEAEHRGTVLTTEEENKLKLMKAKLQASRDFLAKVYEKSNHIDELQNLAIIFENKSEDIDIIKSYDEVPSDLSDYTSREEEDPCYPFIGNWGD